MTKEEYLKSIGYKIDTWCDIENIGVFYKMYEGIDGNQDMTLYIDLNENRYFVELTLVEILENQRKIDDLQIAFNNVKRDFEEMQKYD